MAAVRDEGGMCVRAEERRQAVLELIEQSEKPVSASALASRFLVSRQIIVGDIALLRAAGAQISATPRGYMILWDSMTGIVKQIACQHSAEEMETELNAIVDQGCTVIDVIVEHPLYGQLTGPLHLSSRYEVARFAARLAEEEALPLSRLTEGIHLHTLSCPDESAFLRVKDALGELGILLED